MTSIEGDFVDLVTIEEDTKDPIQYRSPSGALRFETRTENVHIRGRADETFQVRTTIWGPVLPEPLMGHTVAVHWTALDPATSDLGLMDIAEVTTITDVIPKLHRVGGPPLKCPSGGRSWEHRLDLYGKNSEADRHGRPLQ